MSAVLPDLLTVPEAAAKLRVDESFVYRHWRDMGGAKIGGSLRIPVPAIAAYIDKCSGTPRRRELSRARLSDAATNRILQIVKEGR